VLLTRTASMQQISAEAAVISERQLRGPRGGRYSRTFCPGDQPDFPTPDHSRRRLSASTEKKNNPNRKHAYGRHHDALRMRSARVPTLAGSSFEAKECFVRVGRQKHSPLQRDDVLVQQGYEVIFPRRIG